MNLKVEAPKPYKPRNYMVIKCWCLAQEMKYQTLKCVSDAL